MTVKELSKKLDLLGKQREKYKISICNMRPEGKRQTAIEFFDIGDFEIVDYGEGSIFIETKWRDKNDSKRAA